VLKRPKLPIKRVELKTRIESRLASLIRDLARHKNFTVGEMLEETLLHTFEKVSSGGVASPHTEQTFSHIQKLKRKHRINYKTHVTHKLYAAGHTEMNVRVNRTASL